MHRSQDSWRKKYEEYCADFRVRSKLISTYPCFGKSRKIATRKDKRHRLWEIGAWEQGQCSH